VRRRESVVGEDNWLLNLLAVLVVLCLVPWNLSSCDRVVSAWPRGKLRPVTYAVIRLRPSFR
jgi:hypothetical protein